MKRIRAACCAGLIALAPAAPASAAMPYRLAVAPAEGAAHDVAHRRGFYVVGGVRYYNGYRGVVVARPGYRYFNGYWFPGAAFAAGVAVGHAASRPAPYRYPAAHIRWCAAHYRSYRVADNSFQPYHGPRQPCWSPYS